MAKLDGLGAVLEFLKGLQPKIAAQLAKKVLALNVDPLPSDSKALKGYSDLFRVDSGEYRIVYRYLSQNDLLTLPSPKGTGILGSSSQLVCTSCLIQIAVVLSPSFNSGVPHRI
jgi:mRNA interferase RelE/StbE